MGMKRVEKGERKGVPCIALACRVRRRKVARAHKITPSIPLVIGRYFISLVNP
jgi:hypothetical protein